LSLNDLFRLHGFPKEPPMVPTVDHGWLSPDVMDMLPQALLPGTKLVVELGSWLGKSTRFIADKAPGATVVAVDTWAGSKEHHLMADCKPLLPVLYDTFLKNCWEYRQRILPLRTTSAHGLEILYHHAVDPDVIYIDASHEYPDVLGDVQRSLAFFPKAVLCGDDWKWEGVRKAVTQTAKAGRMKAWAKGNVWWREHPLFAGLQSGAERVQ
jgi:hypothetical protein